MTSPAAKPDPRKVGRRAACIVPLAGMALVLKLGTDGNGVGLWLFCAQWGFIEGRGTLLPALWVIGEAVTVFVAVGVMFGDGLSQEELRRFRWQAMRGFVIARPIVAVVTYYILFALSWGWGL